MPSMSTAYQREYRKRRKAEGRPILSGSKVWDPAKKKAWKADYYSRPEVLEHKAALQRKYRLDPIAAAKCRVRYDTRNAIRHGILRKEPCHCGSTEVEAHHNDYDKPLDVIWLCRKHHVEYHTKVKT